MSTKAWIKISLVTVTLLTSFNSIAKVYSLEELCKRTPFTTNFVQEIEVSGPDLIKIYDKAPSNEALGVLLYTIAKSSVPVVVKFYSNYCGPCVAMGPIVQKISNEFDNKVMIIEVDTTAHRTMLSFFDFRYIPTLIFFDKGTELDRTNTLTEEQLREKIEALI